jgi:tetratricopeptide (TPR) repeat protein
MRRENLMARVLRALSGKTQEQFGHEAGVHPSLIAQIELGHLSPRPELLARMAERVDLTLDAADEILRTAEDHRQGRRWRAGDSGDLDPLGERLRHHVTRTERRMLALPQRLPKLEDRSRAGDLFQRLMELDDPATAVAVVRVAEEFQDWALCEHVCEESERAASRDLEEAEALALLAREIAERVPGPEGWRNRVRGFAAGHLPNVLRVAGELKAAEAGFVEARQLWDSGSDPDMVLDPGRLLDLEASLRRDQRRFDEALALLDEAFTVGRRGAHVLVKKGFTLEVMGDYERAVETLLQAAPLVEAENDARLRYMRLFNLAVCKTHLGHYGEASQLLHLVRQVVTERGDENELSRVIWLDGRIAAGLGRQEEALALLGEARQRFAAKAMWYDVALALLEEAVLLLEEGRATDVRELAKGLVRVFDAKGVHQEAIAALRLFQEAAEREAATTELARRVLRFLFRARWDGGLQFAGE